MALMGPPGFLTLRPFLLTASRPPPSPPAFTATARLARWVPRITRGVEWVGVPAVFLAGLWDLLTHSAGLPLRR